MIRRPLSNGQWTRIERFCPGKEGDKGRHGEDNCLFVDGVLWIARTGAPWRDLPAEFGNWNSVFQRFRRWAKKGVWERIVNELRECPDYEYHIIDATIVRAHQHAAGAKKGGADDEAIGRSRGGLSTKINAVVDAPGVVPANVENGRQALLALSR